MDTSSSPENENSPQKTFSEPDQPRQSQLLKRILRESSHILVLYVFAIAQPLYDVLGRQAGFFTANQLDGLDIFYLVLVINLVIPVVLILIKELPGWWISRWRTFLHCFYLTIFTGLMSFPAFKAMGSSLSVSGEWLIAVSVGLGILFVLLYNRQKPLQSFITFLFPAALVFPLLFLFASDVTSTIVKPFVEQDKPITNASIISINTNRSYPPLIFIVFDEFPAVSLMDEQGRIDRIRYPNFAKLADRGYWFENTFSVGASTLWAVPAILTGQMPTEAEEATAKEKQINLFTVLKNTHNPSNVMEKYTQLCPPDWCKRGRKKRLKQLIKTLPDLAAVYLRIVVPNDLATYLPDVSNNWGDFSWDMPKKPMMVAPPSRIAHQATNHSRKIAEPAKIVIDLPTTRPGKKVVPDHTRGVFHKFLDRMEPYNPHDSHQKPPLYFIHILLPHVPYDYLPSGKHYRMGPYQYFTRWETDRAIRFDYQRHLLQLGATDALIGDLIARLRQLNLYEESIVVLVADHGASWTQPGQERRKLTPENYADLIQIPFLIKMPGRVPAKTIQKSVRTIDILPTLADLMGVSLPTSVDGQSIFDIGYPDIRNIHVLDNMGEQWYDFPVHNHLKQPSLQRKLRWFGSGDFLRVFQTGPYGNLVGQPLNQLRPIISKTSRWKLELGSAESYEAVDLNSHFIPSLVEGRLTAQKGNVFPEHLAIAVNGVIGCTYPYWTIQGNTLTFGGLVPESLFHQGRNTVRVFVIDKTQGTPPRLTEIPAKQPFPSTRSF